MQAETKQRPLESRDLPIEVRVGLDVVFERVADSSGVMRTRAIGDPALISTLANYGRIEDSLKHLTVLGAELDQLRPTVTKFEPNGVIVLAAGKQADRIRRFRANPFTLPIDMDDIEWRQLGFARTALIGIQGVGSLGFATGNQLFNRMSRPDLADRCRIAMLRTLVTSGPGSRFATIIVSEYRRAA